MAFVNTVSDEDRELSRILSLPVYLPQPRPLQHKPDWMVNSGGLILLANAVLLQRHDYSMVQVSNGRYS